MKTICKHTYPFDLCGICNPIAKSDPASTPETESAIKLASDPDGAREVCDLCERMERERNAAIAARKASAAEWAERIRNADLRTSRAKQERDKLREEVDQLNGMVAKLREKLNDALEAVKECHTASNTHNENSK